MKESDFADYDDAAVDFVFSESSKMLDETFKSFRESINKSFIVFAIYSGILSYSFNEALKRADYRLSYIIAFIGALIGAILITRNLLPGKMILPGTNPKDFIDPYFSHMDAIGKQVREMKIGKILDHHAAIDQNIKLVHKRSRRFNFSVWLVMTGLAAALAVAIRRMCFN